MVPAGHVYPGFDESIECEICGASACAPSHFNHVFATPWTVVHQAPLSMRFSRQEYCTGLPFPPPGDLPDPGINPKSPKVQADSLLAEPLGSL